ncbi:CDC27 family protein, partial [bacterium]|nr:CDC27 family protein [bacterium]
NTLIKSSVHDVERARYSMELAAVSLFYLDQPAKCLVILDDYVGESFDANRIRFLALKGCSLYQEAILILEKMLTRTSQPLEKSVVLFHYGLILVLLKKHEEAHAKFKESYGLTSNVSTLIELTKVSIVLKKTDEIKIILEKVMSTSDPSLRDRAQSYLDRMI